MNEPPERSSSNPPKNRNAHARLERRHQGGAYGHYDLVILGAENRAIQHRLFFGYDAERLLRATRVPVLVVVPNVARIV